MPLLDHFHAPLSPQRHWESFHVNWAGAIAAGGEIDVWAHAFAVGGGLSVLPLALDAETVIRVDLEETYSVARQRRRLG